MEVNDGIAYKLKQINQEQNLDTVFEELFLRFPLLRFYHVVT